MHLKTGQIVYVQFDMNGRWVQCEVMHDSHDDEPFAVVDPLTDLDSSEPRTMYKLHIREVKPKDFLV